ncbi:beta-ketoacyl synthase N-terminal-like domain-containing protein [Bacillus sp. FSL K6-0273]|uniref:beta-ketoacyl synthase N-terminal-like domain-containing protein n=1 Tax=Bacillus TaxID=1386 RepID=UPI0009BE5CE7|nr:MULTISPECIES: beta-ketoacyl synthase N-terminal-like domain-containing protein [Bacillus cereus group]MDA2101670.1 beta-ketoacyl synthase N-terminal-like domain-containing protein [Bacillus cereus]MDA2106195.1 beta-ketoacyl synthase N-terminal-like domain-containing protein [Bacillus cereus]PGL47203.1 hypothetical protein CN914_21780 [Bacillus thuringiensis]
MIEKDPIVVTGIGTVTPFGFDVNQFWDMLLHDKSDKVELQKIGEQKAWMLGDEWDPKEVLGQRGLRYMIPGTKYLLGATKSALAHAKLLDSMPDPTEVGIVVGCNFTAMNSAMDYDLITISKGPRYVSPMQAPNALMNSPASQLGIKIGAKACNTTISTGQNAGLDALGYGMNLIKKNRANYVIVGGVEHLDEHIIWLYEKTGLFPSKYSVQQGRPFSSDSCGIIASEGAGAVILERKSNALARGAVIWGEIEGWENRFSITRKKDHRAQTLKKTICKLLNKSSLSTEEVHFIVSGANGCKEFDLVEEVVLEEMFGHEQIPVYPVKQKIGESFGAGGVLQFITALGIMAKQKIPEGINVKELQAQSAFGLRVNNNSREMMNRALLTSQNYSGELSVVLVRNV